MILPRLQNRSQSSRKPLQQRAASGDEPPRIGTTPVQPPPPPKPVNPWDVQPQGIFHPLTATPMTEGNPPRPAIEALPRSTPAGTSQATHRHPLTQPAQQGPPNKQVRRKAFPYDQQPPSTMSMASPSAVDTSRMNALEPKRSSNIFHAD